MLPTSPAAVRHRSPHWQVSRRQLRYRSGCSGQWPYQLRLIRVGVAVTIARLLVHAALCPQRLEVPRSGTSRQSADGRFRISPAADRRLDLSPLGRPRGHRPGYTKADVGETAIVDSEDYRRPCPLIGVLQQSSDIDLVGDLNGVIDLDVEVGSRAFDFRMPGRHRPWRVCRCGRSPKVHGQHRRRDLL